MANQNNEGIHEPKHELQYYNGLHELKEKLNRKAAQAVESALTELKQNPGKTKELFLKYYNIIRYEIFGDGCLGPATASANPYPFLEELGAAYGMYKKIRLSTNLNLEKLVRITHKAAIDLEKNTFFIITGTVDLQKIFEFKTKSTTEDILTHLNSKGLTFDSIVYLDIEEQYYDMYRCRVLYDSKDKVLIIRGRSDFVDNVFGSITSH